MRAKSHPRTGSRTSIRKGPPLGLKKASPRLLKQGESSPEMLQKSPSLLSAGLQTLADQFDVEGPDSMVQQYLEQTPEMKVAVQQTLGPEPQLPLTELHAEAEQIVLPHKETKVTSEDPRV